MEKQHICHNYYGPIVSSVPAGDANKDAIASEKLLFQRRRARTAENDHFNGQLIVLILYQLIDQFQFFFYLFPPLC